MTEISLQIVACFTGNEKFRQGKAISRNQKLTATKFPPVTQSHFYQSIAMEPLIP
jgi:hypothetical protein